MLLLISGHPANAAVVRDSAFGSDGVVTIDGYDGGYRNTLNLAVTTDRGVVVAIAGARDDTHYLSIVKLRSDGSIDTTFGGGLRQLPLEAMTQPASLSRLLPLPDGGVLAFLPAFLVSDSSVAVLLHLDRNGQSSAAFNGGKPLTIRLPAFSGAWSAYTHGDGFLLAAVPRAGLFNSPDQSAARKRPRFIRVTAAGLLDPDFGQSGYLEEPEQDGLFGDVVVLPDRRFQILHSANTVDGQFVNRWRRYLPDGRVDGSGGTGGWIDIGDDGRRSLVNAFALAPERAAVVDSLWRFSGYVDGEGRMAAAANFLNPVKVVLPFGADRALVGIYRESYMVPTDFDGAFVTTVDVDGIADPGFIAPGQPGPLNMLRVPHVTRTNLAVDSPSTFIVGNYNANSEIYLVRYREIPHGGQNQPVPVTNATTLLLLAAILVAATAWRRTRTTRPRGHSLAGTTSMR